MGPGPGPKGALRARPGLAEKPIIISQTNNYLPTIVKYRYALVENTIKWIQNVCVFCKTTFVDDFFENAPMASLHT